MIRPNASEAGGKLSAEPDSDPDHSVGDVLVGRTAVVGTALSSDDHELCSVLTG